MNAQLCSDPLVAGVDPCQLMWQSNCKRHPSSSTGRHKAVELTSMVAAYLLMLV